MTSTRRVREILAQQVMHESDITNMGPYEIRGVYGMSKGIKALAGIAALVAVPGALSSFVVSSLKAAERYERARLELELAVRRVQPILTPEGFVKLEELARVAAQFQDVRGFLSAVSTVLGARIECQCWWCRLKRWTHSIAGKMIVHVRGGGA